MQVYLLVHQLGHWVAAQVMVQQGQRHDQGHQTLPVVLDETQELPTDPSQALSPLDRYWSGGPFFRLHTEAQFLQHVHQLVAIYQVDGGCRGSRQSTSDSRSGMRK
jgi:hypothetical protein